ncbi:putative short-chain dehydrogenase/reductase SDR, NAD(P)-binding domain superfamily [Septoria linicola]|nr:putative short-chain dehydrogenase/reductase SDR, NAD(P)-binding domain superfamily [Septoria linicola]
MAAKQIVLITGANGGIGFEAARQLIASANKHVLLGSRSVEKGEKAVAELQSLGLPGPVELVQLDVSSYASIAAAARLVADKHGRVDCIVNNAAISGALLPQDKPVYDQMRECFQTNAIGPVMVVDEFAHLLKKSTMTPRIINVSSGAGSIERRTAADSQIRNLSAIQYRASKAALNMVTADQAVMHEEDGWKVFAYCPGFTVSNLSDLNQASNGAKPTSEGTKPLVDLINGKRDAESGKFVHTTGQYPW